MKRSLICAVVFVFAAVGGWMLPAPEAGARPVASHTHFYYSDATMTELVGMRELDCYGHLHTWGVQTEYRQTYSEYCGRPPGGEPYP